MKKTKEEAKTTEKWTYTGEGQCDNCGYGGAFHANEKGEEICPCCGMILNIYPVK